MIMKVYCQQCGAKIEFSVSSKPKFCHGCGESLSLGSDRRVSTSKVIEEEEAEDEVSEVPSIGELEIEIESYTKSPEKLGDAIGTIKEEASKALKYPNQEQPKLSKEEFRKQFQQEAGTLRSGKPIPTDEKE
jgi:ribosomal protein S27E